jgi:hypothetical protein
MPFADEFPVADRPALRQLVHLDEAYTNVLMVLVDAPAVRICMVITSIVPNTLVSLLFWATH